MRKEIAKHVKLLKQSSISRLRKTQGQRVDYKGTTSGTRSTTKQNIKPGLSSVKISFWKWKNVERVDDRLEADAGELKRFLGRQLKMQAGNLVPSWGIWYRQGKSVKKCKSEVVERGLRWVKEMYGEENIISAVTNNAPSALQKAVEGNLSARKTW